MTTTPPPSATDEQIIERLATEVMGWQIVSCSRQDNDHKKTEEYAFVSGWNKFLDSKYGCFHNIPFLSGFEMHYRSGDWNPLTDWNHWRQVEEKVMEDEELSDAFFNSFDDSRERGFIQSYVVADLPTRAKALIQALDNA